MHAGKAFSTSSELAEAPLQLTVAGLAAVFFDDACWDLTTGVARAMQTLSGRYPDLVTTAVEARCTAYVRGAIDAPRFERISVLAALLSMRAADAVVRRQWTGITRAVTSVANMYLTCASTTTWPVGLPEADCARHLLDAIKLTVTLFQASEREVRAVVREVPTSSKQQPAAESDLGCICSYLTCLHKLLMSDELARDCTMAAGAALIKLLGLAAKGDVVSQLFSSVIRNSDKLRASHNQTEPWLFTAVAQGPFEGTYRQLPKFSQLSVVRGLLSSLPLEVLCAEEAGAGAGAGTNTGGGKGGSAPAAGSSGSAMCLHDSIFEFLTAMCDESADHHLRFQALSSLHLCLRQTLTRTHHGAVGRALMADKQQAVLRVIWNSLEDPSSGISGQIKELFDYLLDARDESLDDPAKFWADLASRFLGLDWRRKGKYTPLTSITSRLGARTLIQLSPGVLREIVLALAYGPVASVAGSLLESMLKSLTSEHAASQENCMKEVLPALMEALHSGDAKVQGGALNYALPIYIKCVPDCLSHLLDAIRDADTFDSQRSKLWALVAVLRVARAKSQIRELLFSDYDYGASQDSVDDKELRAITVTEMQAALTHEDGELRLAALELLTVCYKTTLELTTPEYELIKLSLPLSLSLDDTSLRSRCRALMGKLFVRMHQSARQSIIQLKPGSADTSTVTRMKGFLKWMVQFLCDSASPGSSFDRKWMALLILKEFTTVFFSPQDQKVGKQSKLWHAPHDFDIPFVFTPTNTMVLIHAVIDSWEKTRQLACDIIQLIPGTLLPGFETPEQVATLVVWTRDLIASPRVQESDAGALLLRVVYRRYILGAGWSIKICDTVAAADSTNHTTPAMPFLWELVRILQQQTHGSTQDMESASLHSLVHGVLLTLRYCISETNFRSVEISALADWRKLIAAILEILEKVAEIALWAIGDKTVYGSGCLPADSSGRVGFVDVVENSDGEQMLAPKEQMLVVGAWLSCKETSSLLGALVTQLPLPLTAVSAQSVELLSPSQMSSMGQLLMKVLLTTRHNGAIEKTFLAFQQLCKKAVRSPVPSVSILCSEWLNNLLTKVIVEDAYILRRSAGIPFCVLAVLYAEGDGGQRPFLKQAMETLLRVANDKSNGTDTTGRIHSLNVLRSLIKDTQLSLDVMPFVASAFVTAIQGAQSNDWGITNSSSQLFAALIARSMGKQRVNDNEARAGVTAVEFFCRFPELQPYLLDTLRDAEKGTQSQAGVDPGAYYALLLLSKLLPSVTTESNNSLDEFMPVVKRCCAHENYMGRCVATAALTPFVPEDQILAFMSETLALLPTMQQRNEQHGYVLVLQRMISSFLGGSWNVDDLVALLETCQPCFALLEDRRMCCMVRLDLLDVWVDILRTFGNSRALSLSDAIIHRYTMSIIRATAQCMLDRRDRRDAHGSLGNARMRMKAAEMWEAAVLSLRRTHASSIDVKQSTQALMSMLTDPTYAMQIAGLKLCKRLLRAELHGVFDMELVQDHILQWGVDEKRDYVLKHVCSVAVHTGFQLPPESCSAFWTDTLDGRASHHNVLRVWNTVVSTVAAADPENGLHSGVAHAVRFMGIVVAQACDSDGTCGRFVLALSSRKQSNMVDRMGPWVDLIVQCSDASELSSTRGACVDSLASAQTLLHISYSYTDAYASPWLAMVARLWSVLIQLMQDENEDIRIAASRLSWSVVRTTEEMQPLVRH